MTTATAETKTTECPSWCRYDTGQHDTGTTHHSDDMSSQIDSCQELCIVREDPHPDPTAWPKTQVHSVRLTTDAYLSPEQARRLAAVLVDLADRCEAVAS